MSAPTVGGPAACFRELGLNRLWHPHSLDVPAGVHVTHPGVFRNATHWFQDEPPISPGVPYATGKATQRIFANTKRTNGARSRTTLTPLQVGVIEEADSFGRRRAGAATLPLLHAKDTTEDNAISGRITWLALMESPL